jgi:hypothetical protein
VICSYAFDWQRMSLRCSDGLYLAFGLAVMFFLSFGFANFGKNLVCQCSLWLVMLMPLTEVRGTTGPDRIDHWDMCSAKAMSMLVFKIGHRRVDL